LPHAANGGGQCRPALRALTSELSPQIAKLPKKVFHRRQAGNLLPGEMATVAVRTAECIIFYPTLDISI